MEIKSITIFICSFNEYGRCIDEMGNVFRAQVSIPSKKENRLTVQQTVDQHHHHFTGHVLLIESNLITKIAN